MEHLGSPAGQWSKTIRNTLILYIILSAFLLDALPVRAAPGDLDDTFGTGGTVFTTIGDGANGQAVALQPDGKIVVAGSSNNGSDNDFTVVRYNTDGTLDDTFGTAGIVTTDIAGNVDDSGNSVVLQPDGKIVVAGFTDDGVDQFFAVVRYNTDGALDGTFGTGGIVTTDIAGSTKERASSAALQSDGKIVVAGSSGNGIVDDIAVVRYNTDGSLDGTFGTGGIVTTDNGGSTNDNGNSIALQPDGKIIVAGHSDNGSDNDFAVVRYNPDGALDDTFGTGGIVTTNIGTNTEDEGRSVVLQSDGKIVVAGYNHESTKYYSAVIRYNTDGSLDDTFGTGGIVTTNVDGSTFIIIFSATIQSDGKIVAAGFLGMGFIQNFCVFRYNTDGSLDDTFGTGGIVNTDSGGYSYDMAFSVAVQADGKIVVAGITLYPSSTGIAVFRYHGAVPPTLTTAEVSSITNTGATCGGEVTSDGGGQVTARGVCWNTSAGPTTDNDKTEDGTGTGAFTSELTGLSPGTTYYVRAYAVNAGGTAYGEEKTFTTTEDEGGGGTTGGGGGGCFIGGAELGMH